MKELANAAPDARAEGEQAEPRAGVSLIWSEHAADLPAFRALSEQTFTIGRGDGNTFALVDDDAASRLHATIRALGEHFVLSDLGSTNGTWVSGRRVTEHLLADDDVIRVGNTLLCFVASDMPAFARARASYVVPLAGVRAQAQAEQAISAACAGRSIMLRGEPGTGKEELARAIHEHSGRHGTFVTVCCRALHVEGELFGDVTGPLTARPSLLSRAQGGTLFFDELSALPLEAQAKLASVLSEGSFWPLGAMQPQPIDVRVISASTRSLELMTHAGALHSQLMSKLAEHTVNLRPLRERREDLGFLVDHFLSVLGRSDLRVSFAFMDVLSRHDFPGNVRELASVVKLAAKLARDGVLGAEHLPEALHALRADEPTRPVVARDSAKALRTLSAGRAASN